jgi:hypothetical protein
MDSDKQIRRTHLLDIDPHSNMDFEHKVHLWQKQAKTMIRTGKNNSQLIASIFDIKMIVWYHQRWSKTKACSRVSQFTPVMPNPHMHWYSVTLTVRHVPLFWHGLFSQASSTQVAKNDERFTCVYRWKYLKKTHEWYVYKNWLVSQLLPM